MYAYNSIPACVLQSVDSDAQYKTPCKCNKKENIKTTTD